MQRGRNIGILLVVGAVILTGVRSAPASPPAVKATGLPAGLNINATEPKANTDNNVLLWELGTLLAKQEKNLQMKLVASAKGDVMPQAWVTFTGSSVMRIHSRGVMRRPARASMPNFPSRSPRRGALRCLPGKRPGRSHEVRGGDPTPT